MARTVLITGASGNIGTKIAPFLKQRYVLRLVDIRGGSEVLSADLSIYQDHWAKQFEGVDTVIHLAGEMRPAASWQSCYSGNVLGTRNVLSASRKAQVRRVIFASTNQIMAGYRFLDVQVTSDAEPKPLNPYAISKLICEELGKSFCEETGISFIALRIGMLQTGENIPRPGMGIGLWGQQMWLSDRDAQRAIECSIEAKDISFSILNLVSQNFGMRWDMSETEHVIGFQPQDSYTPVLSESDKHQDDKARRASLVPGYWLDQHFNQLGHSQELQT